MRSRWSGHYPAVVKDSWPVSFLLLHGLARKPRRTRRGSAQLATRTVSVPRVNRAVGANLRSRSRMISIARTKPWLTSSSDTPVVLMRPRPHPFGRGSVRGRGQDRESSLARSWRSTGPT